MDLKKYEPKYQCWVEKDFLSDRAVMRMSWLQRHFYRTLLQAAFNVSTRPYLPADDATLAEVADAESIEQWVANKGPVLAKFSRVTKDGVELLEHKRILSDWHQVLAYVESKAKAGKARQSSARAQQTGADALKPKVKLKGAKALKENEMETEPATAKNGSALSYGSSLEPVNFISTPTHPDQVQTDGSGYGSPFLKNLKETFEELFGAPAAAEDFEAIIGEAYAGERKPMSEEAKARIKAGLERARAAKQGQTGAAETKPSSTPVAQPAAGTDKKSPVRAN